MIFGTRQQGLSARAAFFLLLLVSLLMRPLPIRSQEPSSPSSDVGRTQASQDDRVKQLEKQLAESRELQARLKSELDEQRRKLNAVLNYLTFAPGVEVQNEDYIQARAHFHTKLVRHGPAPDKGSSDLKPPPGVTEIKFPSGSLLLKAWVNRPVDESHKLPAVLFLHGGYEFDSDDWERSKPYRDAGFIVLTPILRGENGQPGSFSYFYDEIDDVLAAAEYLSKQPYVDAGRMFLAGHSVGGTLTLLTTLASSKFRAAASFSGASFWPKFAESKDLPFDRSDPREIQLRSPMAYASSFKCPLRMFYGTEEDHLFGLMSQRTAALARKQGLDVEAQAIEGNHSSHVQRAMMQSIAFFQKNDPQGNLRSNNASTPLPAALELDLGNGVKMKLVRIEPGKFLMGSPSGEVGRRDDERQHEMQITKPYAMGIYTVTQAQYRQVMGMNPSQFSAKGDAREKVLGFNTDDFPVENLTWDQAVDFCRVLSLLPALKEKGWMVDLPTEAEWEYAARAGTETAFNYGNSLSSEQANFNGNNPYGSATKGPFLQRITKVGSYAPNAWGLFDMHGNVLQWCKDSYDKDYKKDGQGVPSRVARGGFWGAEASDCRAARRVPLDPTTHASAAGFRVVVR